MNRRLSLLALCAPAALALACATTPTAGPAVAAPELLSQELEIAQTLTRFDMKLQGVLRADADAILVRARYEQVVDGKVVHQGEQPFDLPLPAGHETGFSLSASSQYVGSAQELEEMNQRGGSLLAALRGTLVMRLDGAEYELPFARSREVRVPRLPSVTLHQLDGAKYSPEKVNVIFYLGVVNPNPFLLRLHELTHQVKVAGKPLRTDPTGRGEHVSPASTGVFEVQVEVSPETFGPEVKKAIQRGALTYEIAGTLAGDLFEVPYAHAGELKLNTSK
jgi:LEA14-like dessication related protein